MNEVLSCSGLVAGHRGVAVVHELDLSVHEGELVALLGPNGAGKTTTLLTLAGLLPAISGAIDAPGEPRVRWRRPPSNVVLVPDDRSLFRSLNVRENLFLACTRGGPLIEDVLGHVPELEARLGVRAGLLSGGEQQMLAIGRAILQQPRVLLIDELSMGLAPIVAERLLAVVKRVADELGTGVVLVEQHVRLALGIADHAVVLAHGTKVLEGPPAELQADPDQLERAYLAPLT